MRAGTRRPSPCRASIGRAQEDRDGSTRQARGSTAGGGKKASRIRDRDAGPSCEPSGWANFAKKDNARRRYCTNPGRARDWPHGDPVRATFYRQKKMIRIFVRCSNHRKLFHIPKIVFRYFLCSQYSRRVSIGSTPSLFHLEVDHSATRSYQAGAAQRSGCRAPPMQPYQSMT